MRYGATVKSVDDSAAKKVPGFIKAVTLDDKTGTTSGWVVAVANTYANAKKAADALKITYDGGPNAKLSSQSLLDEAKRLQALDDSGQFFVKDGDTAAAFGTAAKVLEAEYTTSINIHAPLEPMNATARAARARSGTSIPATSSRRAPARSRPVRPGSIPSSS